MLERARTVSGIVAAGLVDAGGLGLIVVWGRRVGGRRTRSGAGGCRLSARGSPPRPPWHRLARLRTGRAGYLAALGSPAILLLLGVLFWWN